MTTASIDLTFENLVNLLTVYSEGKAQLAELEAENNKAYLDLVDERKSDYGRLQLAVSEADSAIKAIAEAHPEWFPGDQRTLKTPYGSVHAQHTTRHEAQDEGLSIALIEKAAAAAQSVGNLAQANALQALIKTEKTLDLEMLAKIDAETCARFRVLRIEADSITIKEAKVSLGNAVKAAAKKETKKKKGSEA